MEPCRHSKLEFRALTSRDQPAHAPCTHSQLRSRVMALSRCPGGSRSRPLVTVLVAVAAALAAASLAPRASGQAFLAQELPLRPLVTTPSELLTGGPGARVLLEQRQAITVGPAQLPASSRQPDGGACRQVAARSRLMVSPYGAQRSRNPCPTHIRHRPGRVQPARHCPGV